MLKPLRGSDLLEDILLVETSDDSEADLPKWKRHPVIAPCDCPSALNDSTYGKGVRAHAKLSDGMMRCTSCSKEQKRPANESRVSKSPVLVEADENDLSPEKWLEMVKKQHPLLRPFEAKIVAQAAQELASKNAAQGHDPEDWIASAHMKFQQGAAAASTESTIDEDDIVKKPRASTHKTKDGWIIRRGAYKQVAYNYELDWGTNSIRNVMVGGTAIPERRGANRANPTWGWHTISGGKDNGEEGLQDWIRNYVDDSL